MTRGRKTAFLLKMKYDETWHHLQTNTYSSSITQDYKLLIKSDWSHASIGGGPFFRIEDQGNGAYMWIDGSIIGMSFKYLNDKCIIYGSEGDYFCTLYKR